MSTKTDYRMVDLEGAPLRSRARGGGRSFAAGGKAPPAQQGVSSGSEGTPDPSNTGVSASTKPGSLGRLSACADTLYISGIGTKCLATVCTMKSLREGHEIDGPNVAPCRMRGWSSIYDLVVDIPMYARGEYGCDVRLLISDRMEDGYCRAMMMLGSSFLARRRGEGYSLSATIREAWSACDGWVSDIDEESWSIRRLDLCVDHWGIQWSWRDIQRMVTRKRVRRHIYEGNNSCTYYLGRRGSDSVYMRCYNKTVEAADTAKEAWMRPIWRHNGWDGEQDVWRLEVEFGGAWLEKHGVRSTPDEIDGLERSLWEWYTSDTWLPTTSGNSNHRMRPRSPKWLHIASADRDDPVTWVWQPERERDVPASDKRLHAMSAGCIASRARQRETIYRLEQVVRMGVLDSLRAAGSLGINAEDEMGDVDLSSIFAGIQWAPDGTMVADEDGTNRCLDVPALTH